MTLASTETELENYLLRENNRLRAAQQRAAKALHEIVEAEKRELETLLREDRAAAEAYSVTPQELHEELYRLALSMFRHFVSTQHEPPTDGFLHTLVPDFTITTSSESSDDPTPT